MAASENTTDIAASLAAAAQPPSEALRPKLQGIQYLRGLAALQVVIFHASKRSGYEVGLGNFGVPLFFVISGFLMYAITSDTTRPAAFLKDRILRVLPIYWIATASALLLGMANYRGLRHLAASFLFVPFGFLGAEQHVFPVLPVGWTLNYEMYFYSLFALVLFAPRRFQLGLLTALFFALIAAGVVFKPASATLGFWTQPLILQFLAGVWIAWFWRNGEGHFGWPLLGIFLLILSLDGSMAPQFQAALWAGLKAVFLLLAVLEFERRGTFRKPWKLPALLGDASYSIYLWHTPALFVVVGAMTALELPRWLIFPVGAAAGVALGLLGYRFIEKPLLTLFRRRRTVRGVPVPAGP
jgi:exopolysaccharide production protein ExoZ